MKVLINGINGKMGQEVANVIDNDKDILLLGGVDKENTGIYTYPVYTNTSDIEEKPDVIIDFSVPVATLNILKYAKENHVPIVIATTGFTEEQLNEIENYSKDIPVFKSANMSYDINLMAKIVASLAKELPDTDIEIIETHHNRKIDSPSGTALFLADSINEAKDNKMIYEFDRHNKHEKRNKLEIGFSSIRGGNIVGEHTVQFFGEHETLEITNTSDIEEKPDVIIDFSVPVATLNILKYAKENHVPIVIATTGFTEEQLNEIENYSKDIPVFKSANMSYDINLMAKIVASLAKELPDTDIEIIETHHNRKIDSPSGTALFLADSINEAKDNKMIYEFDRHNKHEKRNKLEIGFSSIRGGNIVGEHTVQFFGEHETLEITHKCYSRTVFANGAVMAAKYIVNKDNGMYNMNDLINNK